MKRLTISFILFIIGFIAIVIETANAMIGGFSEWYDYLILFGGLCLAWIAIFIILRRVK